MLLGLAGCGTPMPINPEGATAPAASDGDGAATDEESAAPGAAASGQAGSDRAALSDGTETAAAPVDPGTVIGRTRAQVDALLGPPVFIRRDGKAEFWRYRHRSCVLELYFYPHNGESALGHMEIRGGNKPADDAIKARCLGALIASQPKKG